MTFTRKAGWGHPSEAGGFSGAPGDASHFAGAGAGMTPRTVHTNGHSNGVTNGVTNGHHRNSVERKPVGNLTNGGHYANNEHIV